VFDDDGRHVGTKVTREVEWDDVQRESLMGLLIFQGGICPGCGFHHDLTSDKANHFAIEERSCNVCKGVAPYLRVQADSDHKAVGDKPAPNMPRPSDGRTTSIRLKSPFEVEERRSRQARPRAAGPSRA
jgi:hypothetical protein